jgi:hypothetical protein
MNEKMMSLLMTAAPYMVSGVITYSFKYAAQLIHELKGLRADINSIRHEAAAFKSDVMGQFAELKTKSREQEADLRFMGERNHAIVNALTAMHGIARAKGWRELPDLDFPQREF